MKTVYELKHFKSSKTPDLSKALKLYSENIEPAYRTDTNEIIYWIDHFEERFGDSFFILGLYLNDLMIGFAQLAYFKEEKFVQADYLVISKEYRKNNAFYEFMDKIAMFSSDKNIVYDYIICEVGCYFEDMVPTENSKTLIRLLKMSHFGVLKSAYYVPRLGKKNYESQMRAILMIYCTDELKQIRKETYMLIVNTVFYKYYQRWYIDFFTEEENKEYKENLDELYEKIKKDVDQRKNIEINGYQNLLPLNLSDLNVVKSKKGVKIIAFLLIFILGLFCFGGLAIYIKQRFDLDFEKQSAILTLSVLAAALLTSFIFGTRTDLTTKLVEKLIDKI